MMEISKNFPFKNLCLTLEESLIPVFFQILQSGFRIDGNVGCSVKSLLCEQFGVAPEYLEQRIQTIFLDGKTVDDVEAAIVKEGATLSLSAALPGLVGAVMRKGGYYAPMRDQISYKGETTYAGLQPGQVFMKLFNLPLIELGPLFLERGVWIDKGKLKDILIVHADDVRKDRGTVSVDGRNIDADQLLKTDWGKGDIFLQVKRS